MNMTGIPLLDALGARMSWLNARQSVLSQNVANADTPGYLAKDLKTADFASVLKGGSSIGAPGLSVTDPLHIPGLGRTAPDFTQVNAADTSANPTGNTVSLEEEMIKVADNQAQYQAASNLYAKSLSMMRRAIGQP